MNPLTVFPRHPSAPDTYYINGAWAPAAITAVEKRFTDAELAAEVWIQYADLFHFRKDGKAITRGKRERRDTINRFAELPHAFDGPA